MEKFCGICGKNFETHNERKKYCSVECAKQAKKLQAKKIQIEKVCVVCGKKFITHSYDTKTCLPECSSLLRKKSAKSALKTLGKNKVIKVPDEELKVRMVSFTEDYKFTTLWQAVNFLSAFTEFNTEECIELLRERKTKIGEYKFFYD